MRTTSLHSPMWTKIRRGLATTATVTLMSGGFVVAAEPAFAADVGPLARVDNPYAGAQVYVNPEWSANAAAEPGGGAVANQSTGVWLDRVAAINGVNGGMGLRDHLNTAVSQGANLIQLVIYDLPGRDCSALASNGELGPTDIDRYEHEYIDPIATILSDPAYANLRIVTVVEIDSIPNLVTNITPRPTFTPQCDTMAANGNYVTGIGYALAHLGAIENVYNYLDIGHHGWIGWDDNFSATADKLAQAANASGSTTANVAGFITNTANYGALQEPFFTINDTINNQPIREHASWIDFNRYIDEQSFAQAFRTELTRHGFDQNIGMLIDTSRNGWGGTARPTGPGPMTDANAYVDGGRIDRRSHLGNWCNHAGAGVRDAPGAGPAAGTPASSSMKSPRAAAGGRHRGPHHAGD